MTSDVDHVWKLMKSTRFCMPITGTGNTIRSRPMGAFVRPEELAIYFFADRRAHIDDEIRERPLVHLTFADPHRQK
jgi:general stress protein 26